MMPFAGLDNSPSTSISIDLNDASPKKNEFIDDDFFETNAFLNNEARCCFCSHAISLMPFVMNGKQFCDVLCARLYFKLGEHLYYDKHQYDIYYKNGLLSALASSTYRILRSINIEMLPIMNDDISPKDVIKSRYTSILMSYVAQVMT